MATNTETYQFITNPNYGEKYVFKLLYLGDPQNAPVSFNGKNYYDVQIIESAAQNSLTYFKVEQLLDQTINNVAEILNQLIDSAFFPLTTKTDFEVQPYLQDQITLISNDEMYKIDLVDYFEEPDEPEEPSSIEIINVTVSEATTNKQTKVRYNFSVINETYPFDAFFAPSGLSNKKTINQQSDQWLEYDRYPGTRQNIVVDDISGSDAANAYRVELFEISDVNTIPTTGNGSVQIISNIISDGNTNYTNDITPTLEYSIDNVNWQSSNEFLNVVPGDYTAYVRDEFGRRINQTFTVSQIQPPEETILNLRFKIDGNKPPFNTELRLASNNSIIDTKIVNQANITQIFESVSADTEYCLFVTDSIGNTAEYCGIISDEEIRINISQGFNHYIYKTIQNNNKYIICGSFTSYFNDISNRLIRLNQDGSIDTTFNIGDGLNDVSADIILDNNKYLVGGIFSSYNNTSANKLVRLNLDGTIDNTFNLNIGFNQSISRLFVDSNGKYLVGGNFSLPFNKLVRLNQDGSIDNTFDIGSGFEGGVDIRGIIQDGTKYLISGQFHSFNGNPLGGLIRLNQDGTIDSTFNMTTGFSGNVLANIIDNDKYLVGGDFMSYNGNSINNIVRLNQDGSIDNTFNFGSGFNNTVHSIFLDVNNKYLIAGNFSSYNGTTVNKLVRLNQDGSIDNTFNAGNGFDNGFILSMFQDYENNYIISGFFTEYNNSTVKYIVKLNQNGEIVI